MHPNIELGAIEHITVEPSTEDGQVLTKKNANCKCNQPLEISDIEIITSVKKDSMACQRNE